MVALMKSLCLSFVVLASFATLFSVADANRFNVGGDGAWVVNQHESYNTWAASRRFQINDTLYFKYAMESDSVQVVTNADYDACNVKNPIEKFDNGETKVALNRSGPFYFISGNQEHCTKGQKLVIFVLGDKNHQPKVPVAPSTAPPPHAHSPVSPVAPAKAPSTAQPPKAHSPVSPVAPAKPPSMTQPPKARSPVSPVAPAMAPKAHAPVSPAKPPSMTQPPMAHSPVSPAKPPSMAHSPVSPVAPAKGPSASHPPKSSVSPAKAPTPSPATHLPPSKSPTPSSNAPKSPPPSPKSPSPAAPAKPPTSPPATPADSSPAPSKSTPADDNNHMAPAPSPKSAATVVTVTSVMSTLFGVAFTVFMFA